MPSEGWKGAGDFMHTLLIASVLLAAQSLPLRVASPRHDRPAGRLSQATRTVDTGPYSISRVNLDARLEGWFGQRAGECRCVKRNQVENWASQSVSGQGSSSVKWLMQLAWMTGDYGSPAA